MRTPAPPPWNGHSGKKPARSGPQHRADPLAAPGGFTWTSGGLARHLAFGTLGEADVRALRRPFVARNFGVNLVLSGTGRLRDPAGTHALAPGVVFTRRPGRPTWQDVPPGAGWREWYCTIDPATFRDLDALGLLPSSTIVSERLPASLLTRLRAWLDAVAGGLPGGDGLLAFVGWLRAAAEPIERDREARIRHAAQLLERDVAGACSLREIAAEAGLGLEALRKGFRAQLGVPPGRYRILRRIEFAKVLLTDDHQQIKTIAESLGYADAFAFSAQFRAYVGCSPRQFRRDLARPS